MKRVIVFLSGIALVLLINGCATSGGYSDSSRVRTAHVVSGAEAAPSAGWEQGLFVDTDRF